MYNRVVHRATRFSFGLILKLKLGGKYVWLVVDSGAYMVKSIKKIHIKANIYLRNIEKNDEK